MKLILLLCSGQAMKLTVAGKEEPNGSKGTTEERPINCPLLFCNHQCPLKLFGILLSGCVLSL